MTKWLASIRSVEEAHTLSPVLPDILDMKNPSQGALGALPVDVVTEIVELIDQQCQTSATIGDLAMDANIIGSAMIEMATSGVDYVKIGLFPDANLSQCLADLTTVVKGLKIPVIAVIFADHPVDLAICRQLAESGFQGVMVDTAFKNGKHLLDHMSVPELTEFVSVAKQHHLLCGLAGALKREDIALLASLEADYLGFRSALCDQRERTGNLNIKRTEAVKNEIEASYTLTL